ncbi:MAG: hypothetical protein IIA48_05695, partial [Bacteroidetes bacterium]|nr:hypothetical protein [Bacteroidota bacterium]
MIIIKKEKQLFLIVAVDVIGKQLLNQPIHKLYLKNHLDGIFNQENNTWSFKDDVYSQKLQKLINHFTKYYITYKLDEESTLIIKDKQAKIEGFNKTIKSSLLVKRKLSINDENEIIQLIKPEFVRELKKFQLHGLKHLITIKNGANFSVPGSGKTSVVLAYYCFLIKNNIVDSLFVIGPTSSFEPWQTEFKLCFNYKHRVISIAELQR